MLLKFLIYDYDCYVIYVYFKMIKFNFKIEIYGYSLLFNFFFWFYFIENINLMYWVFYILWKEIFIKVFEIDMSIYKFIGIIWVDIFVFFLYLNKMRELFYFFILCFSI